MLQLKSISSMIISCKIEQIKNEVIRLVQTQSFPKI